MAKVGASAGWHGNVVETITAAKTLSPSDSGKIFDVTDGAYDITLPQATVNHVGVNYRFILTTGGTSALTMTSYEANDLYYGGLVAVTGIVASTSSAVNGMFEAPDASNDRILTITNNANHNGIDTGTDFSIVCIAENKWWFSGYVMINAAEDDDGALVLFS